MEPLYVHLAIWLFPVSKPNIQIQIETPFGKWQFHGSFSKYCELWYTRLSHCVNVILTLTELCVSSSFSIRRCLCNPCNYSTSPCCGRE